MALENTTNPNEDAVKRGKLLMLSLLIAFSIFVQTIIKSNEGDLVRTALTALIYFVVSFVGLIWAFNFQVKIKSIPFLMHSSLFVLSEYLFIQLFFIQRFSRLYEGVILLILVGLIFVATYVSFLMTNVFNVNLYRNIPLVNVGRTASYIISTLTLFFTLFGLLALQLSVYILLPLVIVISLFLSYIHLKYLGYEAFVLRRKTLLVSLIVIFVFVASFMSGVLHEVSALMPVVGYFAGMGIANIKSTNKNKNWEFVFYISLIIVSVFVNFWLNILA
jgi:hypothetical protein